MAGRPTKLTPELQERLCKLLRSGNTRREAAVGGGITYDVFRKWVERGNRGDKAFVAFVASIKEAEAKAVIRAVALIRRAGREKWQALAWWLERKYPEVWGSNSREIQEVKKQLAELVKLVQGRQAPEAQGGGGTPPG